MSREDAKRFIEDAKKNSSLKEKSKGITEADAIVNFARENGFDFTTDELNAECKSIELTFEELENVSGGKKNFFAKNDQVGGFFDF